MNLSGGPIYRLVWVLIICVLIPVFIQEQIQFSQASYHANDLKHLYLGSRLLVRQENPYPSINLFQEAARVHHPDMQTLNPYVYPPFTGYVFFWLGRMDYSQAKKMWFWWSLFLLILSLGILSMLLDSYPLLMRIGILVASVAFFFPHFRSITAGQLNHVLLLLLSLIFFAYGKGYRKTAGALIGFAALIKVQPAFLVLWLAWKREWPAFTVCLVTIFHLILLPAIHFGLQPYFQYADILKQMSFGASTWSEEGQAFYVDPGNIGFPALVYRLFSTNPRSTPWLDLGSGAWWMSVVWSLGVLGYCLRMCRIQRKDEDPVAEMATWIYGMLLIPSLFWDHYLLLLLPSWIILLSRLPWIGLGDWSFVVSSVCWVWLSLKFYWFDPNLLQGPGMLYLNVTLPPVCMLFLLTGWIAVNSSAPQMRERWEFQERGR